MEIKNKVINCLQDLEEIGGPESPEEYVKILESIKLEIEKRIDTAKSVIELKNNK